MTLNKSPLRWGILSTAQIARKNWQAIRLAGNSIVTAVASRDLERSRRFIAECQAQAPMAAVPRALGSYEELLSSADVDAVYIPLPTGLRKEWVLRAAAAGKHVVCEKPCAMNAADLREMIEACQRHQVQFMDGVMFMHSRRLERLRQVLNDENKVGKIQRLAAAFTFSQAPDFFTNNIRAHSALEPFGCLGDLGWYCLRFALWVMNWQMPLRVAGWRQAEQGRKDSPSAVPTSFCGELFFAGGVSASFYCSFLTETEQWARISGTRGCVRLSDFVLPVAGKEVCFEVQHTQFQVNGCDFQIEIVPERFAVEEYSHSHATAQETSLFRNFTAQVLSGQLNSTWPEMALKTQLVMEACLESARDGGRSRPVD